MPFHLAPICVEQALNFRYFVSDDRGRKEFLFEHLKTQPIWHSLRYWNAAFFDAVQSERENKPMIKRFVLPIISAI